MTPGSPPTFARHVGPVLAAGPPADAVLAAIRQLNEGAEIQDRGAYVRVLVPGRCLLRRSAIEAILGRPFELRSELEAMMPSFKGRLTLTDDEAVWALGAR